MDSLLVSVWGTCDGTDILFSEISANEWETVVPADLQDGEYIVEIWGRTQSGFLIYTTAILYLTDARCVRLKLMNDGYYVRIGPKREYRVVLQDVYQVICQNEAIKICVRMKPIITALKC